MCKKLFFLVIFIFIFISITSNAFVASPGTNATLEFVENFTSGIGDKLLDYARSLFVALATLSLAMGLGKMILSGESNIGSVAAHVAKWIIYVGIFFWIMSSSGVAWRPENLSRVRTLLLMICSSLGFVFMALW